MVSRGFSEKEQGIVWRTVVHESPDLWVSIGPSLSCLSWYKWDSLRRLILLWLRIVICTMRPEMGLPKGYEPRKWLLQVFDTIYNYYLFSSGGIDEYVTYNYFSKERHLKGV